MDSMEVDCKRKDGSWHPCQISLSVGNAAIIVAYESSGEEEEEEEEERIESKEEGLTPLRFRSAFLQGGECSRVKEGQSVLALHESSSSNLFFDAVVEKKGLKTKKGPESNSGRRVTRSESKQEIELPVEEAIEKSGSRSFLGPEKATEKDVTSSFLSPGEATEIGGTRSFLSPLAARAALASLMSTRPVTELPKQPERLYVSPETSKAEIARFPLLSPLAACASLASFASEHPTRLPKQAKKPPLTPNRSDYNLKPAKRQTVNSDSEKVDYVIPRRVTRSAVKKEGVDQIAEMEGLQKARGTKRSNKESGNSSFTPDAEDVVTPAKTENKKRIGISPSASSATSASIVTNTISDSEDDTCQDSES